VTNVLITGASRGIGLEIVKQTYQRGWRVFATCRSPQRATELQALANASGGRISVHQLDVSDLGQIQSLSFKLANTPIDVLINNAGRYGSMKHQFGNVDTIDWIDTFQVNCIAPYKVVEAFILNLEKGEQKKVINISSKMGSIADNSSGGSYIYRTTKTALNAVLKSLAIDLKDKGITCVNLHPGWVKTDMGGPNAEITTETSVNQMLATIERINLSNSGEFIDIDGSVLPW
jgi:NAD(P)-dependent dehydrogenase (short-subunit alcohol dehydrogenase family)